MRCRLSRLSRAFQHPMEGRAKDVCAPSANASTAPLQRPDASGKGFITQLYTFTGS